MVAIVSGNGFGLATGSAGVLGQSGVFGNPNLGNKREATYVNVATGNLVMRDQDDFVAALGADIALTRTYNSLGDVGVGTAPGWRNGLVKQVAGLTGTLNTKDSTITRIDGDGSAALYRYDGTLKVYVSTDGGGGSDHLSINADQEWVWTSDRMDKAGIHEVYSTLAAGGNIKSVNDQTGVRLTYRYDSQNRLSQLFDASGDIMSFSYNASNGYLSQVGIDGPVKSSNVYYFYDNLNRLATVLTDLTPADASATDGKAYTTKYTYRDNSNQIASTTQNDGTTLTFGYTQFGALWKVTSVQDGLGQTTTYNYDSATQTSVTDPLGSRTVYTYDAAGQLLSVAAPAAGTAAAQVTSFTYDPNGTGNVMSVTDPRGLTTKYGYDANGNRISETGAAGNVITRNYDLVSNRLLSETRWPDGTAATTQQPVPVKLTTNYFYDTNNRLRYTVSPEGRVQETRYDAKGLRASLLEYAGALLPETTPRTAEEITKWALKLAQTTSTINRTDYGYDSRGLVTKTSTYVTTRAPELPAVLPAMTAGFTGSGNNVTFISTNKATNSANIMPAGANQPLGTTFRFNMTTPATLTNGMANFGLDGVLGSTVQRFRLILDGSNLYTQQDSAPYKWIGSIKAGTTYSVEIATNDDGKGTVGFYNTSAGTAYSTSFAFQPGTQVRLAGETYNGPGYGGATLGSTTALAVTDIAIQGIPVVLGAVTTAQYVYDLHGQLLQTIDGNNKTSASYTYDGLGRQLTAQDSLGNVSTTNYDNNTRSVQLIQANGLVTNSIYDAAGRVLSTTQSDAQGTVLSVATNAYDKDGRLRLNVVNGQNTYLLYDAADRRIASIDANGNLTAYYYNADNQVSRTISYDQRINTAQLRDANGNWLELGLDKFSLDLSKSRSTWNAYDKAGRLAATVDATGSLTRYVYDNASRLLQVIQRAVPVDLSTISGVYVPTSFTEQPVGDDQISRNYYDKDGQLLAQVDAAGYLTEYRYDGLGQRIETIEHATAISQATLNANPTPAALVAASGTVARHERYFYNIKNQLAGTLDNNNFLSTLSYDLNGNISERRRYAGAVANPAAATLAQLGAGADDAADVVTRYTYTTRNELSTETTAGITTRYTYDKLGKLLEKRVGLVNGLSLAQTELYDTQGNLIAELNAEGSAALAGLKADSAEAKAVWDKYATEYTYNGNGLRLTATDPNGNKTRYYYDAAGHPTHVINALGEIAELVYSNYGQVTSKTSYGTRINAATLATLNGGQDVAGLVTLVGGLRNTAIDSTQSYEYDADGRQTAAIDALGYRDTVKYDNFGRVDTTEQQRVKNGNVSAPTSNPGSRSVYDADGRLIASINSSGLLTAYTYDALDRLSDRITYAKPISYGLAAADIKALLANPATQRDNAHDMHQRFFYDGLVTTVMTAKDTSGTQVNWSVVKSTYDGFGNLVKRIAYANTTPTADSAPAAASYPPADAADNTVLYAYDSANRLSATATSQPAVEGMPATTTPINWSVVRNSYDAAGNLAATTAYAKQLSAAAPTAAQLSGYAAADTADATTYYTYDSAGRVKTVAIAQNSGAGGVQWAVTGRTYDTAGNLVTSTQYATAQVTASAQVYPVTAPVADAANDRVTTYRYDAANRLQVTIDAAGGVTRVDYDARGNLTQRINYAATASAASVTAAYNPAFTADDRVTRTIYDRENRAAYTIDALGQVSDYRYDEFGNLAGTGQYAAPLSSADFAALTPLTATLTGPRATAGVDRLTRYSYDRQGKLRFTVDPAGYLKENVYNALGQLIETRDFQALPLTILVDPLDAAALTKESDRQIAAKSVSINSFTYDGAGNLLSSTDALRNTEYYGYDALGRKTKFTNKAGNAWTYAYDAAGHLVSETSPQVTSYEADFNAAMGAWGAGMVQVMVTTMKYDMLGNLISRLEAAGTKQARGTVYGYDLVGRQTSTVRQPIKIYDAADPMSASNAAVWEKDSGDRVNTVGYNAFGEAVVNRDAAGNVSYKVYDARGQVRYDIDAMGYVTGYDHNAFGDVTTLTRYNQQATTGAPTPDKLGAGAFAVRVRSDSANDRTIRNAYDVLGRLVKTSEPVTAVFDQHSTSGRPYIDAGKTTATAYDRFGQIRAQSVYGADANGARVTDAAETRNFYDLRGNRTAQVTALSASADGHTGTGYVTTFGYTWDGVNRVVTQTEYSNAGAWDDTKVNGGAPPAAAVGVDRTTSSAYNLAGQLVRQSKLNVTFVSNGQQTTGNIDTRYGYDVLGNQNLVADALGGNIYTYYDKLGRAIAVAKFQTAGVAGVVAAPAQLTEFKLDILGNIALRIEYAAGAAGTSAPTSGLPPAPADAARADNRVTMTHYNLDGSAIEVQDAEQLGKGTAASIIRTSYDVLGHAVKQWRTVTSGDAVQTAFQITRYDALGRVAEVETPPIVDLVGNTTRSNTRKINNYNAFGEIIGTSVASGPAITPLMTTKYDQAGRAWYSNDGGIDTVTLFDAQGHATAQIRSTNTDASQLHELGNLSNAMAARALGQQLRTDTQYDLMGRVIDSGAVSDQPSVLKWSNGGWVKVAVNYDTVSKDDKDNLIIIGRPEDDRTEFRVQYRVQPNGAWIEAGPERVRWLGGYPVFSTAGLPSGDYEYNVLAKPFGEAVAQVRTGALHIDATDSKTKDVDVISLYLMLTGNVPDAATLNTWISAYNKGATLADIAGNLYASDAFKTLRANGNDAAVKLMLQNIGKPLPGDAAYAGSVAAWSAKLTQATTTAAQGEVLRSLLDVGADDLKRRADAVANYLLQGGSDPAVVATLLAHANSTAYDATAEGTAAATLETRRVELARLYLALYGRAPDQGGFDGWIVAMARAKQNMESVALDFLNGFEAKGNGLTDALTADQYNEKLVRTVYLNLLGRAPTVDELNNEKSKLPTQAELAAEAVLLGKPTPPATAHAAFVVRLGREIASYTGGDATAKAARTMLFNKVTVSLAYAAIPFTGTTDELIATSKAVIAAITTADSAEAAARKAALQLQTNALYARTTADATRVAAAATPLETLRMQLARVYAVILNRAPDSRSFAEGMTKLKNNQSAALTTIINDMLGAEGNNAALYPATLDNETFLTRLFVTGLGMQPYSAPLANAMDRWRLPATNANRGQLVLDIINSVINSADPDLRTTRDLLNNKAAVGVVYALNLAANDQGQAKTILSYVTATDTSAAIEFGNNSAIQAAMEAALAAATAASSAARQTDAVNKGMRQVATATNALAQAQAAVNANPMAAPLGRAAQYYVAVLKRATSGYPALDLPGVTAMAVRMQAGESDASMVKILLDSDEGKKLFPPANFDAAQFVNQLYEQALGRKPGEDLDGRAYWIARAKVESREQIIVQMLDGFLNGTVPDSDPNKKINQLAQAAFYDKMQFALDMLRVKADDAAAALVVAQDAANKANNVLKTADDLAKALGGATKSARDVLEISRLYVGVLNRGASGELGIDIDGLNNYRHNRLAVPDLSLAWIADNFVTSEKARFATDNAGFVRQIYQQIWGKDREPSSAVSNRWQLALINGTSRGTVAAGMLAELTDTPLSSEDDLKSKAAFDQRVQDAMQATTKTVDAGVADAQKAADAAKLARDAAATAVWNRQTDYQLVSSRSVDNEPSVKAAAAAVAAANTFKTSAQARTITEVLLTIGASADLDTVARWIATGKTGSDLVASILATVVSSAVPNDNAARAAFVRNLYSLMLHREPDVNPGTTWPDGNWWYRNTINGLGGLTPAQQAAEFYNGALQELYDPKGANYVKYAVRTDFQGEFNRANNANIAEADRRIKAYPDVRTAAAADIAAATKKADDAVKAAQAAQKDADTKYLFATDALTIAAEASAPLAGATTVQAAAIAADKAALASLQAQAARSAAAINVGLPISAPLSDFQFVANNAAGIKAAATSLGTQATANAALSRANAVRTEAVQASASPDAPVRLATVVTQVYAALLKRTPTYLELYKGLASLNAGKSVDDFANALIAANPTIYPATTNDTKNNDAFVTKLYTQATGHTPDTATLRALSDALKTAGVSRGTVVVKMINAFNADNVSADSLAFNSIVTNNLDIVASLATMAATREQASAMIADIIQANSVAGQEEADAYDAAAQAANKASAGQYVSDFTRLYLTLLGRSPEAAALTTMVYLRSGDQTLLMMADSIMGSPEYASRFNPGSSAAQFVADFYRLGLGRNADQAELNAGVAKLGAGQTRAQLVLAILGELDAYKGGDLAKLTARTRLIGNVSASLQRSIGEVDSLRAIADNAFKQGTALLTSPLLTSMKDLVLVPGRDGASGAIRTSATPHLTLDRWGNVLTVADARDPNWKIFYRYNYDNQRIDATLNALTDTSAAHASTGYDALGRVVKTTDYIGNATLQSYDSNGNVAVETHADTGKVSYHYNLFGDRTDVITQRGFGQTDLQTNFAYDHLGHMVRSWSQASVISYDSKGWGTRNQVAVAQAAAQLLQQYNYDELGRMVQSTEADNNVTLNRYDLDGNLIQVTNGAGYITRNVYDAFHHKTATVDANGARLNWAVDAWGVVSKLDNDGSSPTRLYNNSGEVKTGSNVIVATSTTYRYDAAGRKIQQGSGAGAGQNIEYGYTDGLLTRIDDKATGLTTTYRYDLAGNRLTEKQTYAAGREQAGTRQNNTLAYDKQNRVTDIGDDNYKLHYDYDANGNRTHVRTEYDEAVVGGTTHRTYDTYNAYDNMNRQVVVNGDKDATTGLPVYGKNGHAITYDYAGNRRSDTSIGKGIVLSGNYQVKDGIKTVEEYVYDVIGRLSDVKRDTFVINTRHYDLGGRVAETGLMMRSTADGLAAAVDAIGGSSETHIYAYGKDGQLKSQQDNSYVKDRDTGNTARNIWFGEGYDRAGNLRDYTVSPAGGTGVLYTVTYEFTNGYRETSNSNDKSRVKNVSGYDVNGNRTTVTDVSTGNVIRKMTFDADGHVQSRIDIADGKAVEHFSLIVNGQVLGEEDKKSTTVLGSTYAGVSASSQTAPPAFYSVQSAGETLQSIAQNIWGDSKLWYLIADANGIDSSTKLAPGDQLRIPTRVNTVHNDYATFKPYDAAEALGNTAPAMPPPSHGGGCGSVGKLIMIVVAVVVTIYTAGALSGATVNLFSAGLGALSGAGGLTAGSLATAAAAGAAGSIASQAVGNAIGAQDGFSWKSVALSAIGSGVSAGVGAYANGLDSAMLGTTANGGTLSYSQVAARAAVSNTISQGVGMAAGLQGGFSWANVAASYASAYMGAAVAQPLSAPGGLFATVFGNANELAVRTVSGFAAGATASILRGGKVDVAQIATDAFGNALGTSFAQQISQPSLPEPLTKLPTEQQQRVQNMASRIGADINNPDSLRVVMAAAETNSESGQDFSREELLRRSSEYLSLAGASQDIIDRVHSEYGANGILPKTGRVDVIPGGPDLSAEELTNATAADGAPTPGKPRSFINTYVDNAMIGSGQVITKFGQLIEENPFAKYALIGLDVAAGPAAFAVRTAVSQSPVGAVIREMQDAAIGFVSDNLEEVGRNQVDAQNGGVGAMALITLGTTSLANGIKSIGNAMEQFAARGVLRKNMGLTDRAYQAHHLIPVAEAKQSAVLTRLMNEKLYDLNRKENGIALPSSKAVAEAAGLPYHSGSHAEYSSMVRTELQALDRAFALRNLDNAQLLSRVNAIETRMRAYVQQQSGRIN